MYCSGAPRLMMPLKLYAKSYIRDACVGVTLGRIHRFDYLVVLLTFRVIVIVSAKSYMISKSFYILEV